MATVLPKSITNRPYSQEQALIDQVVGYLSTQNVQCFRIQNTGVFNKNLHKKRLQELIKKLMHSNYYNENQVDIALDNAINGSWQPLQNGRKGIPDVCGWYKDTGLWIGVEIKIGTDQMSIHQIEFQQELLKAGGEFYIARDFEQFFKEYTQKKMI